MTSGTFRSVEISSITINRDTRQRKELSNLDELAASIQRVGLIHPITLDKNLTLVAGERRFTACRDVLGWSHITAQFVEDLDESELYLIELEENVKRVDLEWRDQCQAVAEYHRLRAMQSPEWSQVDTASALGVSPSEVHHRIKVQEAIEQGDPLVLNADRYSTARGIVERKTARAKDSETAMLEAMLAPNAPERDPDADDIDSSPTAEPDLMSAHAEAPHPFLLADFSLWQPTYSGPKFNFIHCDFPYGVNADGHNSGAAGSFGGYADSATVYWNLIDTLRRAMDNVVAESAHLMFWYSLDYHCHTIEALAEMGWRVNPFPLVWHKSDNSGIMPDPKRGPRRVYETALLCSRGDRMVAQPVSNLFAAANVKTIHMSEKNPQMLSHFFRMFVDSSTIMLDPTCGSGQAVRVSEAMGASHSLGLERDPTFYANARDAYWAAQEE